ncbi:MAG: tryptophan-rich sensory protein [Phycisphaerae bacterium]|nr:tryptophan-rich sensory protein [Phycisphaerae bacterium]
MRTKRIKDAIRLIACVGATFLAALPGAWAGAGAASEWYENLAKPPFTPPGYVFGIVWPVLYLLMGVALFLVLKAPPDRRGRSAAIGLFAVQLLLNALWTPLFFRWRLIGVALVEIIVLWAFILLTVTAFRKVSRVAAVLLVPYLAWVSFAVVLNAGFWVLNR